MGHFLSRLRWGEGSRRNPRNRHWHGDIDGLAGRGTLGGRCQADLKRIGARGQVSLEGGTEPIWSQQGGETRPGFEVLGRTKLVTGQFSTGGFRDHSYSVAGDAKSFLVFQPLVGPRQALVVALNWFEQMKEPNPKP